MNECMFVSIFSDYLPGTPHQCIAVQIIENATSNHPVPSRRPALGRLPAASAVGSSDAMSAIASLKLWSRRRSQLDTRPRPSAFGFGFLTFAGAYVTGASVSGFSYFRGSLSDSCLLFLFHGEFL